MNKLAQLKQQREKLNQIKIPALQARYQYSYQRINDNKREAEVTRRQMKQSVSYEPADLSYVFYLYSIYSYDNSKLISEAISYSTIVYRDVDSPSLFESIYEHTQTPLERLSQQSQVKLYYNYSKEEKVKL